MEIHPDPDESNDPLPQAVNDGEKGAPSWRLTVAVLIPVLYAVYLTGIQNNPPGYYVDESGLSYNAYLISETGSGESGNRFPLYFQLYTGGFTQYSNPTQIYILAGVYKVFGPSILVSRITAATCAFAACVLLGFLAWNISGNRTVGAIVGFNALLLPWLFEVGRLVLETFFYPLAVVLFLWACFLAHRKSSWRWTNILAIVGCLVLLTYSYTIGRLFGPLMALGLVLLVENRRKLWSVVTVWLFYGISLIPLAAYIVQNPDITARFRMLSYIKPESSYSEIVATFVGRYLQDINPVTMLFYGDVNPRHHIHDALGSVYFATFILALMGMIAVISTRRGDRWWRFMLWGLAASVVPAAMTVDPFHTLRMIAFPVFLLIFTVPAIDWVIEGFKTSTRRDRENESVNNLKQMLAAMAVLLFLVEATYFHVKYFETGPARGYVFDASYKTIYDQAVAQPYRPIYLEDGYWGPMYVHALWYATLEGRDASEFVHLRYGEAAPEGAVVISSEKDCTNCFVVSREDIFMFYLAQ